MFFAALTRAHQINDLMDGPEGRETMHVRLLAHPKARQVGWRRRRGENKVRGSAEHDEQEG